MQWFDVENRLIKILKLLEQKQSMTSDMLVEKLEVSFKTIQNDIKMINKDLKGAAMIDSHQGICKLYIMDDNLYKRLRNDIERQNSCFESPQMRMSFVVDTLMNNESPYLIDELAYAMNIGRSTIVGDIKKLKEILAFYDLDIVGKTNTGIFLSGEEINLRFFILENIYAILYDSSILDEDIVMLVREKVESYRMDAISITYFLEFLTLSLDRLLHDHPVSFSDTKYQELLGNHYFILVTAIADAIEKKLQMVIPEAERLFLTIPFVGMRTPYDIESMAPYIEISEELLDLVQTIMGRIRQEMGLHVSIDDHGMLDEFIYHIYFMRNRMRYGFRLKNPMVADIKTKYGVAYRMACMARDVIEEHLKVKLPEDEIGFLAAYFEIFISEQKKDGEQAFSVAVICGSGRAAARLVLNQLKHVFDSGTELHICNDDADLKASILDHYDLVISTVSSTYDTRTPVIFLNEVFDEDYLRKSIDRIRYIKKLNIPLLRGVESFLLSLLDDDTFCVLNPDADYTENVHAMIDRLNAKGLVDPGFKARIDARENRASMIFDESVAFPHGYQKESDRVVVSVGVFHEAMRTGMHPGLKVIFLVALPDGNEDDTVLVQIYDEIISVANDKKIVAALTKIDSYQDLLMYFIKNCDLFG